MSQPDQIDIQVTALLEKIEASKTELASATYAPAKAPWKTLCTLSLFPGANPVNIQTANRDTVALLLYHLRALQQQPADTFSVSTLQGCSLADWVTDCTKRLLSIELKAKQERLNALEATAKSLRSADLQRQQALAQLLKDSQDLSTS